MFSHSLSESFAGHKKPRTHLAPLQGTSYPLSPQEEPVSVLSPSPWALTARLTAPGCPSMFWVVLHVQLASGELPVKSLPAGTKVNFSHLMAHFSKDRSQKSSLPSWSQRLGAPTSAEGLGALPTPCVWVCRHVSMPKAAHEEVWCRHRNLLPLTCASQKRFQAVLSVPSPVSASQALLHLPPSRSSLISTTFMWSLFFLHLGPTFRNPALCNAAGIE